MSITNMKQMQLLLVNDGECIPIQNNVFMMVSHK